MLDLHLLRYFVAVARTESIARAAAELHISQSPLSRRIIALEQDLGVALFERARKRLRLTEAGRRLLDEAGELLARAGALEQRARAGALAQPRLCAGFVESAIHSGVLQRWCAAARRAAPDLQLELRSLRSAQQFAALEHGEIHAGFTHRLPSSGSLQSTLLLDEAYRLAVPEAHPLAKRRVRAEDLDAAAFIGLPRHVSPSGHAEFLQACTAAGFTPRVVAEAAEPAAALALVAAGFGLAIVQPGLSRLAAAAGVRLRPLPAAFGLRLRLYLVLPARAHPLLQAVSEPAPASRRPCAPT